MKVKHIDDIDTKKLDIFLDKFTVWTDKRNVDLHFPLSLTRKATFVYKIVLMHIFLML